MYGTIKALYLIGSFFSTKYKQYSPSPQFRRRVISNIFYFSFIFYFPIVQEEDTIILYSVILYIEQYCFSN